MLLSTLALRFGPDRKRPDPVKKPFEKQLEHHAGD